MLRRATHAVSWEKADSMLTCSAVGPILLRYSGTCDAGLYSFCVVSAGGVVVMVESWKKYCAVPAV